MNVVAHNILAMNANRQFHITNKTKATSTEKLSSGYRINRAADDAAGLAISEKMRRQIRGLSQGIENTEDGVSLCQVADGALAEVSDMLHRITELSVKSANGTNSADDRKAVQQEISQILQEIDRIGDTTEFNEQPVFKIENAGYELQEVVSESEAEAALLSGNFAIRTTPYITAEGVGISADQYNEIMATMSNYTISKAVYEGVDNHTLLYDGKNGSGTKELEETAIQIFENSKFIKTNISDYDGYINAIDQGIAYLKGYSQADLGESPDSTLMTAEKYANKAGWEVYPYKISDTTNNAVHIMQDITGVLVWRARSNHNVQGDAAEMIADSSKLLNEQQKYIGDDTIARLLCNSPILRLRDDWATNGAHTTRVEGDAGLNNVYEMYNYLMQPQEQPANRQIWIQSGSEASQGVNLEIDLMNTAVLGISNLDVSTADGAGYAIKAAKGALQKVSANRSKIGAQQNRLEHTIANEQNIVENTTSAESRIRDTDMAREMVVFSKDAILENAGQAMLAQANKSNQNLLSLLS